MRIYSEEGTATVNLLLRQTYQNPLKGSVEQRRQRRNNKKRKLRKPQLHKTKGLIRYAYNVQIRCLQCIAVRFSPHCLVSSPGQGRARIRVQYITVSE